mmetsp:Transcript_50179/g.121581  ORF Transcript_50179/g.121581 Transcript_50179/m.121581 type:complete len:165 (-) Transcript_50179:2503-2997(-)|eukprot:CAMPEP_0113452062 /NCGR_PEP_ID=MMETSP0014_2-20120614/6656_1 /TAXON_ID=2857 /ORGANISM="Nitzschia sp." /LENGTH=164 /DNA_ID=CAMNT_0000343429 /DNA_START=91 /DNA_END=585 /DNA_ORIENTATION=- /assembly_acc=CAM_ASM_000159
MKLLRRTGKKTQADEEVVKTPMGKVEIVKAPRRGLLGKMGLKKSEKKILANQPVEEKHSIEEVPEETEKDVPPTEDVPMDTVTEEDAAEPEGDKTEEEQSPEEEPAADERDAEEPTSMPSKEESTTEEPADHQTSTPAPIEDVHEQREQPESTPTATGMLCGCF